MTDLPPGFAIAEDTGSFLTHIGPPAEGPDGTLGLRVDERHLNRAGKAQGGLLAALMDHALARAVHAEADAAAVTVSLTTDYLRPVEPGAWLEARVEVERVGGRLAFADCTLTADGEESVRARAVFAVLD